MLFFTGDLHLGHAGIIESCGRGFKSVADMDETLIANWNARVTEDDDVYIVGDLIYRARSPEAYLARLGGRKHLITGNHDADWLRTVDSGGFFEEVCEIAVISDGLRKITLCHYPMMAWEGSHKGSCLVYGHIHRRTDYAFWPLLRSMDNAFNAGVDINGFRPVTMKELAENNRVFKRGNP